MPKVNTKRALEVKSRDIDSAVVEWYRKARSRNIPVTEPMLQEKACQIADRMALTKNEFRASNGWLEKFKIRVNIKGMPVCGESREVRKETIESWKEGLSVILADYSPQDIFNIEETSKFFRALPTKTLSTAGKRCTGGKQSKGRLTSLFQGHERNYCASMHLFSSEPNKYQIFWTGIKSVRRTRSFSTIESAGTDNWLINFQNLYRAYSHCLWKLNAKMYKGYFFKFQERCQSLTACISYRKNVIIASV